MEKKRYHFYTTGKTTICTTHYHGATVRATTTCHDDDIYDAEHGEDVAKAKVDVKVSNKKLKYIAERKKQIADIISHFQGEYVRFMNYEKEVKEQLAHEEQILNELMKK